MLNPGNVAFSVATDAGFVSADDLGNRANFGKDCAAGCRRVRITRCLLEDAMRPSIHLLERQALDALHLEISHDWDESGEDRAACRKERRATPHSEYVHAFQRP